MITIFWPPSISLDKMANVDPKVNLRDQFLSSMATLKMEHCGWKLSLTSLSNWCWWTRGTISGLETTGARCTHGIMRRLIQQLTMIIGCGLGQKWAFTMILPISQWSRSKLVSIKFSISATLKGQYRCFMACRILRASSTPTIFTKLYSLPHASLQILVFLLPKI